MKRKVSVIVAFCVMVLLSCPAFASNVAENFYMTDFESTDRKDTFSLGETPFLYVDLGLASPSFSLGGSFWENPAGEDFSEWFPSSSVGEVWVKLDDWDWNDSASLGEWNVDAFYFSLNTGDSVNFAYGYTENPTKFTVTPEPIGCTLFAIGGMALAFFRKRMRKA